MAIRGTARVGKTTKILVRRLQPGDIAVIDHRELDDVAAHALLEARVKAVINASPAISDRYPNGGPYTLVSSGVVLLDDAGREIMDMIKDGQTIEIAGNNVLSGDRVVASGNLLTVDEIRSRMNALKKNINGVLCEFVSNTLEYARNEIGLINGTYKPPELKTAFRGRQVLVVVRGQNYKDDLLAIKSYIDEMKPLLVGVDGGADALLESGYRPDLIVGDMDSVSDRALFCGAELVTHAYSDGTSPGLARISRLGLESTVFAAPGTSEDIAMLLAYEMGAELIVLVGSHSSIHDFLEKGRKGMASTFLVRLKVGSALVDAKGVSKLYRSRVKARHLAQIVLAALIPAALVAVLSPPIRQILKLLYIHWKMMF